MKPRIVKMKVSELVMDFELYPRTQIDGTHASHIAEAIRAGSTLPPLVADAKSKRLTDGFHRLRAYRTVNGDDAEVLVELVEYADEREMFLDSVRRNAAHGRALTPFDRNHVVVHAERLSIDLNAVADVLQVRVEKLSSMKVDSRARLTGDSNDIPLKHTIRHMAGKRLTTKQAAANKRLGGMNQMFYVNQVITLIESDLLDTDNVELMKRVETLAELLQQLAAVAA